MPLSDDQITEIVERYRRELDRYAKLAALVADACRLLVRDDAVSATIQWRPKDTGRLKTKLIKDRAAYDSVEVAFSSIKDLAGVRILAYADGDRQRVVDALRKRFVGAGAGQGVVVEVKELPLPSFYRATHCQVWLPPEDLLPPNDNLEGTSCEIQVCSLLAHVWNEIEHDLIYKVLTGETSDAEKVALHGLGHTVRSGDVQVSQLLTATQMRLAQITGVFRNQWDFVARMQPSFPDANDFGTYSGQLFEEMMASGLTTPQALTDLIGASPQNKATTTIEALNKFLDDHKDDVVRLEKGTSDDLAILFLLQRSDEVIDRHPGQGRPPRIASLARRAKQFFAEGGGAAD